MKLPRQPTAVVFDMDGLLFDTESIYERAALLAAPSSAARWIPRSSAALSALPGLSPASA